MSENYRTSEQIAELADAISKAQAEMEGAVKDALNPHFRNKYADLSSVWDACRDALGKQGLSVLQPVTSDGAKVIVTTMLLHKSGQWIASDLTLSAQQNTPQALGSAITYGRRYGLSSMIGIAPEDDDGNAASGGGSKEAAAAVAQQKIAQMSSHRGIDDSDIPTVLGGSYEPPPEPPYEEPKRGAKVPTFSEMMAAFKQIKDGFTALDKEADYYEILEQHKFNNSQEVVKAGVAKAKAVKNDLNLRLQLLQSTSEVNANATT